jgi:hypothetical protein
MGIKSAGIENFEGFSQLDSLHLKRFALFAAKVPGVANAKIGTVLKAIYEEYGEMGMISRSTFKSLIKLFFINQTFD